MQTQLDYGNWIRKKVLLILGLCTVGAGALIAVPLGPVYRLVMALLCGVMLVSFLFPAYSYVMFSQKGGGFQQKVYNLIIRSLGAKGKVKLLDIGSGNGVLAVLLAQQVSEAEITGVDYWGKNWEYSKSVCEKNAHIGKVEGRVHYQKGDAAALEFADDAFDGAVSNLTFHEVRSAADKRAVVREALRVIKPGGRFAFVDYFYDAKFYGEPSEFEAYLKGLHLAQLAYKPLHAVMDVPLLLRYPKILGKAGILYGVK